MHSLRECWRVFLENPPLGYCRQDLSPCIVAGVRCRRASRPLCGVFWLAGVVRRVVVFVGVVVVRASLVACTATVCCHRLVSEPTGTDRFVTPTFDMTDLTLVVIHFSLIFEPSVLATTH